MQLGQIDTAFKELDALVAEHSDAEQAAETRILIGYCHMPQNKSEQAKEVFEGMAQDYPESSWANKARLCVARLKNMGKVETAKKD